MAITNGYTDLPSLRDKLGFEKSSTLKHDAALEKLIEAVSRWIDEHTKRRFYAATETRYYTATFHDDCTVDDLLSVTTLKTDDDGDGTFETTWTTSDYTLYPLNAALDGLPFTNIKTSVDGDQTFPRLQRGVEIAGSFGYSSTTPKAIEQACLIGCMRVWERSKLIYGVVGGAELGTIQVVSTLQQDGEIKAMLKAMAKRLQYVY